MMTKYLLAVGYGLVALLVGCGSSGGGSTVADSGCVDGDGGCGPAVDTGATSGDAISSDSPGDTVGDATGGPCTITLSGAQTATVPCIASANFDATGNRTAVAIVPKAGGASPNVGLEIVGEITAKAYPVADCKGGGCYVTSGDTLEWAATKESDTGDTQGTWTLTLSSVKLKTGAGGAKVFDIQGTLVADLPANNPDTTGSVHMVVNF